MNAKERWIDAATQYRIALVELRSVNPNGAKYYEYIARAGAAHKQEQEAYAAYDAERSKAVR